MKVKTLFQSKKTKTSPNITTRGTVIIQGNGSSNGDINGKDIAPHSITASTITVDTMTSNNITNTNNITTNSLVANTITTGQINTNGFSTTNLSAENLDVQQNAVFNNGMTVIGTSTFDDIFTDNITNSESITTKDLTVTGSAHFFELIIDKVRAAGGAILITPADGFKVDKVEHVTEYEDEDTHFVRIGDFLKVYWRMDEEPYDTDATYDGLGRSNTWVADDQAICYSFNRMEGNNVANKYYWCHVVYSNINPEVTNIDGEDYRCNYLIIDNTAGTYAGTLNIEVGDEIAMLGNKSVAERQAAIYISAFQSLDQEIHAPLIAHYQGINDYTLSPHRKSYFDRDGAKFIGSFEVSSGNNTISLEQYIKSLQDTNPMKLYAHNIQDQDLTLIAMQTDSGGKITDRNNFPSVIAIKVSNNNTDINFVTDTNLNSLTLNLFGNDPTYGRNIDLKNWTSGTTTDNYNGIYVTDVAITYPETAPQIMFISFGYRQVQGGQAINNTSIAFSGQYTTNNDTYDFSYNIPVIGISSTNGEDAIVYKLFHDTEYAVTDNNGKLNVLFRYGIQQIIGADSRYVTPDGKKLRVNIYSQSNALLNSVDITTWNLGGKNELGYFQYGTNTPQNWYTESVNSRPYYYEVQLIDSDGITVLDSTLVYVTVEPAYTFSVNEGLSYAIQSGLQQVRNDAYSYTYTNFSTITQRVDSINSTVTQHTTSINNLTGEVQDLGTQYSYINQRATDIEISVNELDNNINSGLRRTGIDITQGKIVLDADNVEFTNNVNVQGNIHAGLIYSSTYRLSGSSGTTITHYINPAVDNANMYFYDNLTTRALLYFPDPVDWDGLEIRVLALSNAQNWGVGGNVWLRIGCSYINPAGTTSPHGAMLLPTGRKGANITNNNVANLHFTDRTINGTNIYNAEGGGVMSSQVRQLVLRDYCPAFTRLYTYEGDSGPNNFLAWPNTNYLFKSMNGDWVMLDGIWTGE